MPYRADKFSLYGFAGEREVSIAQGVGIILWVIARNNLYLSFLMYLVCPPSLLPIIQRIVRLVKHYMLVLAQLCTKRGKLILAQL